jgi:hypothetical protein
MFFFFGEKWLEDVNEQQLVKKIPKGILKKWQLQRILWLLLNRTEFRSIHRILRNSKEYWGITKNPKRFQRILRNTKESYGIPKNPKEFQRILRNSKESWGIPKNLNELW